MKSIAFLNVHGITINQKKDKNGNTEGYYLPEFEDEICSLQEAVNVACALFSLKYRIIDSNGDPIII